MTTCDGVTTCSGSFPSARCACPDRAVAVPRRGVDRHLLWFGEHDLHLQRRCPRVRDRGHATLHERTCLHGHISPSQLSVSRNSQCVQWRRGHHLLGQLGRNLWHGERLFGDHRDDRVPRRNALFGHFAERQVRLPGGSGAMLGPNLGRLLPKLVDPGDLRLEHLRLHRRDAVTVAPVSAPGPSPMPFAAPPSAATDAVVPIRAAAPVPAPAPLRSVAAVLASPGFAG